VDITVFAGAFGVPVFCPRLPLLVTIDLAMLQAAVRRTRGGRQEYALNNIRGGLHN